MRKIPGVTEHTLDIITVTLFPAVTKICGADALKAKMTSDWNLDEIVLIT